MIVIPLHYKIKYNKLMGAYGLVIIYFDNK